MYIVYATQLFIVPPYSVETVCVTKTLRNIRFLRLSYEIVLICFFFVVGRFVIQMCCVDIYISVMMS